MSNNIRKQIIPALVTVALISIVSPSCYYDKYEELNPTDTTQQDSCDIDSLTYVNDVKPIIENYCLDCHNASGNFPPLTNYDEVKNAVESGSVLARISLPAGDPLVMPQGGKLSDCNISKVLNWKSQGFKN